MFQVRLCFLSFFIFGKSNTLLPGSSPSRIQGNLQDERRQRMRERVRQSSGLSLKFIFTRPLYTLNNIFGGSAHCLHTGHLKTLQQLDLQQKLDVTHILFHSQESFLSFGLQACKHFMDCIWYDLSNFSRRPCFSYN